MKTILLGGPHDGQVLNVSKALCSINLLSGDLEYRYYRVMTEGIAVFASTDIDPSEVYPLIAQKLVELAELKQQITAVFTP